MLIQEMSVKGVCTILYVRDKTAVPIQHNVVYEDHKLTIENVTADQLNWLIVMLEQSDLVQAQVPMHQNVQVAGVVDEPAQVFEPEVPLNEENGSKACVDQVSEKKPEPVQVAENIVELPKAKKAVPTAPPRTRKKKPRAKTGTDVLVKKELAEEEDNTNGKSDDVEVEAEAVHPLKDVGRLGEVMEYLAKECGLKTKEAFLDECTTLRTIGLAPILNRIPDEKWPGRMELAIDRYMMAQADA